MVIAQFFYSLLYISFQQEQNWRKHTNFNLELFHFRANGVNGGTSPPKGILHYCRQ